MRRIAKAARCYRYLFVEEFGLGGRGGVSRLATGAADDSENFDFQGAQREVFDVCLFDLLASNSQSLSHLGRLLTTFKTTCAISRIPV